MAYEIQLYCATGACAPAVGFDGLLTRMSADGAEFQVRDRSSGDGWVAAQVDSPGGTGGCHVEFHAGSPLRPR